MADEAKALGGKLQQEAYAKGREAREGKRAREAPVYARRSLTTAWLLGWDECDRELAPAVTSRDPRPVSRDPRPVTPGAFWPANQPLPQVYVRRAVPCLQCRRVLLETGGRAVKVTHADAASGLAYFRCDGCGKRFKLKMV